MYALHKNTKHVFFIRKLLSKLTLKNKSLTAAKTIKKNEQGCEVALQESKNYFKNK